MDCKIYFWYEKWQWTCDQEQYPSERDNPEVFTQAWSQHFIFVCFMLDVFDINSSQERLRLFLSFLCIHLISRYIFRVDSGPCPLCTEGSIAPIRWQCNLESAGLSEIGFWNHYIHAWASIPVRIRPFYLALSVLLYTRGIFGQQPVFTFNTSAYMVRHMYKNFVSPCWNNKLVLFVHIKITFLWVL